MKGFPKGTVVALIENAPYGRTVLPAGFEFRVTGSIRSTSRGLECVCECDEFPAQAFVFRPEQLELVATVADARAAEAVG